MKILITGGAGFIGSKLARKFLERGDEVVVIDNLSSQVHGENALFPGDLVQSCECITGDVRDKTIIKDVVRRVDGVLHMVAETGMGQSMYQLEQYADVNTRATGLLLDCIARYGGDKIQKVFIPSTSRVYGEGHYVCKEHGNFYPISRKRSDLEAGNWGYYCSECGTAMTPVKNREDDKVAPTSVYGITKLAQEQMLLVFGRAHSIPVFSLRYQNVYGPGQSLLNPYTGVLNVFAQQIKNGQVPEIYEMGFPRRDFVHVDDVVDCTMKAFFSDSATGKVYNVGRGEAVPISKVAEIMMRKMGMGGNPVMSNKFRVGDVLFGCADMCLLQSSLDWNARIGMEEGIATFVDWLDGKGMIVNRSSVAEQELRATGLMGGN